MLTADQENEVASDTNDSALRLYKYYIHKKNWKHFVPTDYTRIGKALNWSPSKTEKCKTMLIKAGYLLLKKDTLSDGTKIYRILVGKEIVNEYVNTKKFPAEKEVIYTDKGIYDDE